MEFSTLPEFDREFGNLLKRYPSLREDLELLKQFLAVSPRGHQPGVFRISGLGISTEVYKVKHFRCKALRHGSRSGIRVIYAFFEKEQKIVFTEIFYKEKDDQDCDRKRILKNYRHNPSTR
jgi:hypothetical protein